MRAVHLGPGPRGYGIANEFNALICTGMTRDQALRTVRGGTNKEPPPGVSVRRSRGRAHTLEVIRPGVAKRLGPSW